MKVKNESEVTQSCQTLRDPMDCSPPGSSVHGIFQARVLEWGAIAFSAPRFEVWTFLISLRTSCLFFMWSVHLLTLSSCKFLRILLIFKPSTVTFKSMKSMITHCVELIDKARAQRAKGNVPVELASGEQACGMLGTHDNNLIGKATGAVESHLSKVTVHWALPRCHYPQSLSQGKRRGEHRQQSGCGQERNDSLERVETLNL